MINTLKHVFGKTHYVALGYMGLIGLSTTYGIARGASNWIDWRFKRPYFKIHSAYKDFEPIVNGIRDGGMLMVHIGATATGCAVVAATFPVSIPLLLSSASESESASTTTDMHGTTTDSNAKSSSTQN
jgi:hypothetical protein